MIASSTITNGFALVATLRDKSRSLNTRRQLTAYLFEHWWTTSGTVVTFPRISRRLQMSRLTY